MHVNQSGVWLFVFISGMLAVDPLQLAEAASDTPPERPAFAHERSDLSSDPRIVYGELDNGFRYAVQHNDTPPGTASMRLRFAAGSLDESPETRGIAHFLEHMAFNGSENVPEGELLPRLERFGLSFGADTNAHTGFDETVYKLNLPNVNPEVIDEAFMLFRETADKLTLDQDAIDRERGIIQAEKRTRNTTGYQLMLAQIGFFASGTGLLEQLPIGTDETIASIDAEQMRAFYEAHYHPEKAFFVFVGDVDPDSVIERIETTFGDWRPETEPAPRPQKPLAAHEPGHIVYHYDPEILPSMTLASFVPVEDVPDTASARRALLVRGLGNSILSHRLRQISDDPQSGLLRGSAFGNPYLEVADFNAVQVGGQPEEWAETMTLAEQTLRRALEFGFTDSELQRELARERTRLERAAARADTMPTNSRFGGLADSIVSSYRSERVVVHPDDRLAGFNAIADGISIDEVNAVFRERWNGGEALSVFIASSTPIGDPVLQVNKVLAASRETAVEAVDQEAVSVAFESLGTPGRIVETSSDDVVDARFVRFDNHVRLNLKSTDFTDDTVRVVVRVGDGALSLPRKDEGLRRLALNLLMGGGTEHYEYRDLEVHTALNGISWRLFFAEDSDAILFSASARTDSLEPMLRLLAEYAHRPGLRRDAGDKYKQKIRAWYETHDASPAGVASKEVPRLVRSGDRRFGFDDLEGFLAAPHEEAEQWLRGQLTTGAIEIAVVGDADEDEIVAAVAATFGALPERVATRGEYADMAKVEFPADLDTAVTYWHSGEPDQALLQMFWSSPDALDVATAAEMRVLRAVMQHRMVTEIREDAAVTYSPGVAWHGDRIAPGYGYLRVSLEVPPEVLHETEARIAEVAAAMGAGRISRDDFDRALTPILQDVDDERHSNAYWLRVLADAQSDRRGIEEHLRTEEVLRAMTVDDVTALARSVLGEDSETAVVHILHSDLRTGPADTAIDSGSARQGSL